MFYKDIFKINKNKFVFYKNLKIQQNEGVIKYSLDCSLESDVDACDCEALFHLSINVFTGIYISLIHINKKSTLYNKLIFFSIYNLCC